MFKIIIKSRRAKNSMFYELAIIHKITSSKQTKLKTNQTLNKVYPLDAVHKNDIQHLDA